MRVVVLFDIREKCGWRCGNRKGIVRKKWKNNLGRGERDELLGETRYAFRIVGALSKGELYNMYYGEEKGQKRGKDS